MWILVNCQICVKFFGYFENLHNHTDDEMISRMGCLEFKETKFWMIYWKFWWIWDKLLYGDLRAIFRNFLHCPIRYIHRNVVVSASMNEYLWMCVFMVLVQPETKTWISKNLNEKNLWTPLISAWWVAGCIQNAYPLFVFVQKEGESDHEFLTRYSADFSR